MNDLGWCAVFVVLLIAFLGSEMSLYEDLQAWLKQFEEQEKLKRTRKKQDSEKSNPGQ